jgi:hypothetical protein
MSIDRLLGSRESGGKAGKYYVALVSRTAVIRQKTELSREMSSGCRVQGQPV